MFLDTTTTKKVTVSIQNLNSVNIWLTNFGSVHIIPKGISIRFDSFNFLSSSRPFRHKNSWLSVYCDILCICTFEKVVLANERTKKNDRPTAKEREKNKTKQRVILLFSPGTLKVSALRSNADKTGSNHTRNPSQTYFFIVYTYRTR